MRGVLRAFVAGAAVGTADAVGSAAATADVCNSNAVSAAVHAGAIPLLIEAS
jgi:hypothetical protein